MTKLLVCIDGSSYADNVCLYAAWVAKRLNADIDLLHVLRQHSDYEALSDDHTGSIGLGCRGDLLEKLTNIDETRGKLDQQKGEVILNHAEKILKDAGTQSINILHRRGSLTEAIQDIQETADIIFMGKRGEHADVDSAFLGSNLEKVARTVHKPLFVVSSVIRPIKKFLIAYDGKESANKAVEYTVQSPLLKGLECHLLSINTHKDDNNDTVSVAKKLRNAGFDVISHTEQSTQADDVITTYVEDHAIDLLLTGAYSHSRIRSLLLGSTTASLCQSCKVPLLLFR
jgi:nucleotide-binding universal stress UspA family protein